MPPTRPPAFRLDAAPLFAALLLLGGAREAAAQSPPVRSGFNTVTFKSASVNEDGYIHANVSVDYAFRICSGMVHLLYGVRAGSAQGSTTYWYKGHNYGSAQTRLPDGNPPFTAEFRVNFSASPVFQKDIQNPRVEHDLSCGYGSQWIELGPVSKFVKEAKTDREKQDLLNRFTFDIGITRAPMRNVDVESGYAKEIADAKAKARTDSVNAARAAKARSDSAAAKVARAEKARTDSIARARSVSGASSASSASSASRPAAPAGSTGAATYGARPAATPRPAAPSPSAADVAIQRAQAARARRDSLDAVGAQRRVELQAQMDARSEATNQSIRDSYEREAQQSAAIDAAMAPLAAQLQEYARAKHEREEAQRERNAILAQQRRMAHFAAAEQAFVNAPWRPSCTERDMQGALPLDRAVSGVLTLQSCRTGSGASAAQYQLVVDRARPFVLSAGSADFYQTLQISLGGTVLGSSTGDSPIEVNLVPGTYLVTVSSEGRGETGGFAVIARRGALSHTQGLHLGLDLGGATTSFGAIGGTASVGQLRLGLGFGQFVTVLGQYNASADGSVEGIEGLEFGARLYVRRAVERLRPFVQVTAGKRSYYHGDASMDGDTWSGKGTTYGAGAEWFMSPRVGLEAGLLHTSGSMTLDSSPATPAQDMSQTRVTFGMTFHK